MKSFSFTDCESVFLLDLISQLLRDQDINQITGKHKLPYTKVVDLTGIDIKVLRSLHTKLYIYLV